MNVKAKIREYWDLRSKSYDKSPGHICLPEVWKSVLSEVFDSRAMILDVGTGTGFLASLLAEMGHEVVGLDLSSGMLSVAKRRAAKAGFVLGDAESLPFRDSSFDAVVCRHLLWTLPNPERAISEWVRVAKDRAVIFDGRWIGSSFQSKLRRCFGRILIGVYERRNPFRFHYSREINKMLPFYGGADIRSLLELCRSMGLDVRAKDLSWLRKKQRENLPFVYRVYSESEYFMVEIDVS